MTDKPRPQFAAKLKFWRGRRKMTQQMLAAKSGVSLEALRKLEQGQRRPLHETVVSLARALEVDIGEFGGRLKPKSPPAENGPEVLVQ